ncbi:MAG: hypothetical protein MI739_07105 [Bacteroidales bacterium]|nr:hypothetical protein [Bacteroidales bacterium]
MDRLVEIFKLIRPRFYNKLTWLLVSSGIVFLSPSIIIIILNHFIEKEFHFSIIGSSDTLIGFSLIILGIAYNVGFYLIENKNNSSLESDRRIFNRLNEILSEQDINSFLDALIANELISHDTNDSISNFIDKCNLTENKFSKSKLEGAKNKVIEKLEYLMDFVLAEFFSHPNLTVTDMNVMRPELNIDRGGSPTEENNKKHIKLKADLRERAFSFEKAYQVYRNQARKYLQE